MTNQPTQTPAEAEEHPNVPPPSRAIHTIALDVDGVVLDFERAARQLLHKITGHTADIANTYNFEEAWGLEPDWFTRNKFWAKIWDIPLQAHADVDALAELTQWVDIHLVSHRPKGAPANALRRDLRRLNLEHLFASVHMVEQKPDKQAVLDELDAGLYVDDHLASLLQIEHPTVRLLRSRPWNQSQDLGDHYTRIRSLYRISSYV